MICPPVLPKTSRSKAHRLMASHQLLSEIRTRLRGYPIFQNEENRRAISLNAGLDEELLSQIDFDGATEKFLTLFLNRLSKYGALKDGRLALQALLEAVKDHVGVTDKEKIDTYIAQLPPPPPVDKGAGQSPKRNWRWIFVPIGILLVVGLVYVIASQRRTIPSNLPITSLQEKSKFEDDISSYNKDGADWQRSDRTRRYAVGAVETTIGASTKAFTWSLSTTRAGLSITGKAYRLTSSGMRDDLTLLNRNENTLEIPIKECGPGDKLVAVVRIGWQDSPSLSDLEDMSSITELLVSKVK
jgi:effector-associated domain 8 (EAD8)-containing protein